MCAGEGTDTISSYQYKVDRIARQVCQVEYLYVYQYTSAYSGAGSKRTMTGHPYSVWTSYQPNLTVIFHSNICTKQGH